MSERIAPARLPGAEIPSLNSAGPSAPSSRDLGRRPMPAFARLAPRPIPLFSSRCPAKLGLSRHDPALRAGPMRLVRSCAHVEQARSSLGCACVGLRRRTSCAGNGRFILVQSLRSASMAAAMDRWHEDELKTRGQAISTHAAVGEERVGNLQQALRLVWPSAALASEGVSRLGLLASSFLRPQQGRASCRHICGSSERCAHFAVRQHCRHCPASHDPTCFVAYQRCLANRARALLGPPLDAAWSSFPCRSRASSAGGGGYSGEGRGGARAVPLCSEGEALEAEVAHTRGSHPS